MDINASTYSDYMMLISPPPEVIEGISKYKKASARLIGDFEGMYGKAHISLTSQYRQIPGLMMQKLDAYRKPVSSLNPVQLHINGFSFFKHGDTSATIYAKIELNAEVANWFIHLKRIFGDKNKPASRILRWSKIFLLSCLKRFGPSLQINGTGMILYLRALPFYHDR